MVIIGVAMVIFSAAMVIIGEIFLAIIRFVVVTVAGGGDYWVIIRADN